MRLLTILCFSLLLAGASAAQEVIYEEYFTEGSLALDWSSAWSAGANIQPTPDGTSPGADGWVGSLSTAENEGGVGTAVAGELAMTDYMIEADVFLEVSTSPMPGPRQGIVARADTTGADSLLTFLMLRGASSSGNFELRLTSWDGQAGGAVDIMTWTGSQLPGGGPTEDSWHKLGMDLMGSEVVVYFDGTELEGSPVSLEGYPHDAGLFGIYGWDMMQQASTLADDIVVYGETDSVDEELPGTLPASGHLISAYPNPFNPSTTITVESRGASRATLAVFDLLGRRVAMLHEGALPRGETAISWNAADLSAGTYFVLLQADGHQASSRVVLMK